MLPLARHQLCSDAHHTGEASVIRQQAEKMLRHPTKLHSVEDNDKNTSQGSGLNQGNNYHTPQSSGSNHSKQGSNHSKQGSNHSTQGSSGVKESSRENRRLVVVLFSRLSLFTQKENAHA